MKRVGKEFDTELVFNDSDNVLVGSKFFNPLDIENGNKEWEVEILQKLSQEMYFLPTMLDYQMKGSAYEYALENIGNMLPLDYYVLDMCLHPSEDNRKRLFAITNNILYKWKSALNDFSARNNVLIRAPSLWEGTVVAEGNRMFYLNIPEIQVRPFADVQYFILNVDNNDVQVCSTFMHRLSNGIATRNRIQNLQDEKTKELNFLKNKYENQLINKNKQLANSISRSTIKATLGETAYSFYFGDSDG